MSIFNSSSRQMIVPPYMSGLLLCAGGNASILVNKTNIRVSRGTLCIISPFLFIEIVSASNDCKWEMICDDKNVLLPCDAISENNLLRNPCVRLDKKQIQDFLFYADKIREKQRMLDSTPEKDDSDLLRHSKGLLEQTAITEFMLLFQKNRPLSSDNVSSSEKVAYNFINALKQNYSTHRDVGWYAEQANITPIYFSKIVHQHTGYAPTVIIKNIIVANAKMLLSQPGFSIKEIASKLSFTNQSTFLKYFKSCTGMSPSQYKKTLGL